MSLLLLEELTMTGCYICDGKTNFKKLGVCVDHVSDTLRDLQDAVKEINTLKKQNKEMTKTLKYKEEQIKVLIELNCLLENKIEIMGG